MKSLVLICLAAASTMLGIKVRSQLRTPAKGKQRRIRDNSPGRALGKNTLHFVAMLYSQGWPCGTARGKGASQQVNTMIQQRFYGLLARTGQEMQGSGARRTSQEMQRSGVRAARIWQDLEEEANW